MPTISSRRFHAALSSLALLAVAACGGHADSTGAADAKDDGNPACTLSGDAWQCPGGEVLACAAPPTQGAACVANTGSCFTCEQGAGIVCSCPGLADAGAVWECAGAGLACQ
jgi:hypothetical protein